MHHLAISFAVGDCPVLSKCMVIPKSLQLKVLKELHIDNLGITRMKALARSCAHWPGIGTRIEEYVKRLKERSLATEVPLSTLP